MQSLSLSLCLLLIALAVAGIAAVIYFLVTRVLEMLDDQLEKLELHRRQTLEVLQSFVAGQIAVLEKQNDHLNGLVDKQNLHLAALLEAQRAIHQESTEQSSKHHAELLRQQRTIAETQGSVDLEPLRYLMENHLKNQQAQNAIKLMQLAAQTPAPVRGSDFVLSLLSDEELARRLDGFLQAQSEMDSSVKIGLSEEYVFGVSPGQEDTPAERPSRTAAEPSGVTGKDAGSAEAASPTQEPPRRAGSAAPSGEPLTAAVKSSRETPLAATGQEPSRTEAEARPEDSRAGTPETSREGGQAEPEALRDRPQDKVRGQEDAAVAVGAGQGEDDEAKSRTDRLKVGAVRHEDVPLTSGWRRNMGEEEGGALEEERTNASEVAARVRREAELIRALEEQADETVTLSAEDKERLLSLALEAEVSAEEREAAAAEARLFGRGGDTKDRGDRVLPVGVIDGPRRRIGAESALPESEEEKERLIKEMDERRDREARGILEEEAATWAKVEETQSQEKSLPNPAIDAYATVEQPFSEAFSRELDLLIVQGAYAEAERRCRMTLPMMEELKGRDDLSVVDMLHRLAVISIDRGKYSEAEETLQQVLVKRLVGLGDTHAETLQTLNDLGRVYTRRGSFVEAKRTLTETLEKRRSKFGDEHRFTAKTTHDLGVLYLVLGRYDDSRILLERSLLIRKKTLGEDHCDLTEGMISLARLYLLQDKLTKAQTLANLALQRRKDQFGAEHPEYAEVESLKGAFLTRIGRFDEARRALEHCLSVRKSVLGERHPSTAESIHQLGLLELAQGDFEAGYKYLNQALYIRKTSLSPGHYETAASMHDLGFLRWKQSIHQDPQQVAEAQGLLEKSYALRRELFGESHPDTLESISSLGALYTSIGKYHEAEMLLRAAVEGRRALFGREHLSVAQSIYELGICYHVQQRHGNARQLLEEAKSIKEDVLGADNPLSLKFGRECEQLLSATA